MAIPRPWPGSCESQARGYDGSYVSVLATNDLECQPWGRDLVKSSQGLYRGPVKSEKLCQEMMETVPVSPVNRSTTFADVFRSVSEACIRVLC